MSDSSLPLSRPAIAPDHPAAVTMVAQPVLAEVAGPDAAPVSLSIEYGVGIAAGESLEVEARIVRGTRTLVFAQARVMNGSGLLAADISAVYRREIRNENGP
ncbi:MAG: hypothetical protein CFE28_02690 [Alphaproteobacteria bacterium PA2]|nr:MAG: hypothetical protein CFE28_02690 [Alphaproteobacteria bacterium PA2]